ncbi:Oidioi.mRNA.OKI2018_I69.chr1.g2619.t1.cds [Oikopleura dioica]|uniref:Oidioi.mRNA.OKI2018_I69.chr1.g2619.t1.cds n=1 Tax=Oikopleura dioica TaxID=34765 RepID=A0ABN7SY11_OIKDI|nr:Oidioi.mRNA.OKI2018_I69.chr1.g2619.t1.cds [Oikopleura dioica]
MKLSKAEVRQRKREKAERKRKMAIAEKQREWTLESDPTEFYSVEGEHNLQIKNFMGMFFLEESEYLHVTCGDGEEEYVDINVGDIIQDDAKGRFRFKIMKKMFKNTHLWGAFGLDSQFSFKEGSTSNIATGFLSDSTNTFFMKKLVLKDLKFSPHIVSIYLAAIHRLPVRLTWVDTCALLEICDFCASTAVWYDYVKPALLRLTHQNFTRIMDMLFLYQTYRTREVDDDKIPINSRNIYDRTFYHILQSSNFKSIFKLNNQDYQGTLEQHYRLVPRKDHLAAACANSSKCFYYRTNWDVRILMVRMWTENRNARSDQDIQSDYMEVFSKFNAPAALNQLLSPSIMRQVLTKGMLVQPNEKYWAFDIKSFPRRIKEYNIKPYGSELIEDDGKKVSEKDIKGYFSYEEYRPESGTDPESGEWGDTENAEDTKKSRERATHERKVKRRLGDKRNELKQAIEDHKNGVGGRNVPLNDSGGSNYAWGLRIKTESRPLDTVRRPLVGKLLKVNRKDKYVVVQWITPGCELLSDVDYAGPGILYNRNDNFDSRIDWGPNSNKIVKYLIKKDAFHIELAEDIFPYVDIYKTYFKDLNAS